MTARDPTHVRVIALAGPAGVGKTALMHALLVAAGAVERRPNGALAEPVGDASPEAKETGHSVETNLARFDFMDDHYVVIDVPGSVDFAASGEAALPAADLVIVVADPDPEKAALLAPTLRALEAAGAPHALFVNRIDQARGALDGLLEALGAVCGVPVVARQMPILEGDRITGYVDLALERAYAYRPGQPSKRIDLSGEAAAAEPDARFHMLEQLALYDDALLEQLLSDAAPDMGVVLADLSRELNAGLIMPAFFGSALQGWGVSRLLKAIRHEIAPPATAQARLRVAGAGAYVVKVAWGGQAGMLACARVFGAGLNDGDELTLADGSKARAAGLSQVQGPRLKKIGRALEGDLVAIGKLEGVRAGDVAGLAGSPGQAARAARRPPVCWKTIEPASRNDEVRLSGALARLMEEDPSLDLTQDPETHERVLGGQGETHLRTALARLKSRWGLDVKAATPTTACRETVNGATEQAARHKKQTGGHGQFADVKISIRPLGRGEGFSFGNTIVGGAVPKQWIPAVEQGVRDAMAKGPAGHPVTDVAVMLLDGGFHPVDSSEMAFRIAGRAAMEEAMRKVGTRVLEPVETVVVTLPNTGTAAAISALSGRRGHVLSFGPLDGWAGWDRIEAHLPRAERYGLIGELRSLSQGLASFEHAFDHMAEAPSGKTEAKKTAA